MPVARTTAKRIAPVWQRQNPKRRPRDPWGRSEGNFKSRGRRRINAGRPHWFCRGLPQNTKIFDNVPGWPGSLRHVSRERQISLVLVLTARTQKWPALL